MSTPTKPQDFRDRAVNCEHLAETATSPEMREVMLYVASRWRLLAREEERQSPFGRSWPCDLDAIRSPSIRNRSE
jgi:hypothetical protein